MHRVIYIDVLFCVNFIIDFLLILSVKKYLSMRTRYLRMLLGAAVGALSSFVILLPPLNEILSLIIRLVTALAVVFAAFFPTDKKSLMKATAAYFLITFSFCGASIAILMIFSPPIAIRNGAVYIDISPIMLVSAIFVCYLIMRVICRATGRSAPKREICRVVIKNNGKTTKLIAKTDTGNTLHEPFSNLPVIVAERDKIDELLPIEVAEFFARNKIYKKQPAMAATGSKPFCDSENIYPSGLRLVPYNSVGGEGILPAFRPSSVKILADGKEVDADAYIAVTERKLSETFSALIPSDLILD